MRRNLDEAQHMTGSPQGWFPDPHDRSRLRWWTGEEWSAHTTPSPTESSQARTPPVWLWLALAGIALALVIALPGFVVVVSLVVVVTGVVALVKGTPTWLRFKNKKMTSAVTGAAIGLLLVAGAVSGATSSASQQQNASEVVPFAGGVEATSPEPEPTPEPSASSREESVKEVIAFGQTTVEDPTIARGQTQITTAGVVGERTVTYLVRLVDGSEVSRELLRDVVTVQPVDQVTSIGTYDEPPPPPPPPSNCDSNYADACVPISSDVDCAWGSGNGPAYFDGVARVVGADIYDLDRDGDGLACEQ